MAKCDITFINMCMDIIKNGTSTANQKVRPIWPDTNEYAYTIKKFGVCNRYDLREEFPALTLRKTNIHAAIDEILWIYQLCSNNINDLDSHIWDEWADENGSIGKAYGYQVGKKYIHHKVFLPKDRPDEYVINLKKDYKTKYPSSLVKFQNIPNRHSFNKEYLNIHMNQIDSVIYDLKNNPFSRRIITNLYNLKDLHEMNLYPCAYSCTFNVTDENDDKLVLNLLLNQRSQDVLVANNWNVVQYAALLMMIAQVCDMIPGKLIHMISDCHIYDRHIPIIKELIARKTYDAPKVTLDPDIKNFYGFSPNSFKVENYIAGEQIKNIPIAV